MDSRALVSVFADFATARSVVEKLYESGFVANRIELITPDVKVEAPKVETPPVHETTASLLVENAVYWGGVGAGAGLLAGLMTGFPGLALGMAAMGGLTGGIVGGMAGVERAVEDDSVNLPTLSEYEQMVRNGYCLVVLRGNHEEVMRGEAVIREYPDIHRHLHVLHGHEFHEHPSDWD